MIFIRMTASYNDCYDATIFFLERTDKLILGIGFVIFCWSDTWWLHHVWRFGLPQLIRQKVKDSNIFSSLRSISSYHIIWFLYFFTFVFSCQVVKSYLTLSEEKRIKTFKNCHSFQNCEIFTCPENWNSLCCRFFVLVKNFSRLPKSRLAILVRELYIAQCLPEKWTSLHLLAPIGALYAIVHCTRTGPQAIHFYNF